MKKLGDMNLMDDFLNNAAAGYEPHKGSKSDYDFPLYNRYRQARMDSRMMRNGDSDFRHMPELYIITITDYDIFGEKGIVYSFENRCVEYPNVQYDDRLHFIYFNTRGAHGGSTRIKNMLTYLGM